MLMLGLSGALDAIGPGFIGVGGTPTPTPAPTPTAPVYTPDHSSMMPALTTAGAAYLAIGSAERVVAGYVGPLLLVNGSAELGAGSAYVTPAQIQTARGGSAYASVVGWYDQSGNNKSMANGTTASQPHAREDVLINGCVVAAFDGLAGDATKQRILFCGAAGNVATTTFVFVGQLTRALQNAVLIESRASATAVDFAFVQRDGYGTVQHRNANARRVPSTPCVVIISGASMWVDGAKTDFASPSAAVAFDEIVFGGSPTAGAGFNANWRLAVAAIIGGNINGTDAAAITASMQARFGLQAYDLNLVHVGDSITESVQASDTITLGAQFVPLLNTRVRYWNMGIGGKMLSQMYADRASIEGTMLVAGKQNILLIDGGINDTNGDAAHDAAIYTGLMTPYVAWAKAQGWKVGVVTLLPEQATARGDAGRLAYNALARANGAGADFVVDRGINAQMGNFAQATDTTKYPDFIHPSTLGYSYLKGDYATPINAALT